MQPSAKPTKEGFKTMSAAYQKCTKEIPIT